MKIRQSTEADLAAMKAIFDIGRNFQIKNGNPNQWQLGYPSIDLLKEDIASKSSFVCVNDDDEVIGTFSLLKGDDPTYRDIEGGEWLNSAPYVTIHRIASKYEKQGIGRYCIEWVLNQHSNIKIDTHQLNKPMRNLIEQLGFVYCGIIYLLDGRARVAYQYYRESVVKE